MAVWLRESSEVAGKEGADGTTHAACPGWYGETTSDFRAET